MGCGQHLSANSLAGEEEQEEQQEEEEQEEEEEEEQEVAVPSMFVVPSGIVSRPSRHLCLLSSGSASVRKAVMCL